MRLRLILVPLLASLALLPVAAPAQENPPVNRAEWVTRLTALSDPYGLETRQAVQAFGKLEPQAGAEILSEAWGRIPFVEIKRSLLMAAVQAEHPFLARLLHLGATDPALSLQNWALALNQYLSFDNFQEDYRAYLDWQRKYGAMPLETVIQENARAFAEKFRNAPEEDRGAYLKRLLYAEYAFNNALQTVNFTTFAPNAARRRIAAETGLLNTLAMWATQVQQAALAPLVFQAIRYLHPDEGYLRRVILPLTAKGIVPSTRSQALGLLASPENRWAAEPLLRQMLAEYPDASVNDYVFPLSMIGDPKIIPTVIAILDADDAPEATSLAGRIIGPMTGVGVNERHDAAWWRNWWERNKLRFAPEVQNLPFPKLNLRKRVAAAAAPPPEAPIRWRIETRRIGGDAQRTYLLLYPQGGNPAALRRNRNLNARGRPDLVTPKGGYGLLVALSGSGNPQEVARFWTEVAQNVAKGRYFIALPVAPKWSAAQKTAWVTEAGRKRVKEAKFTTEQFLAEIVKDVGSIASLDGSRIFLHGVAEGGAAAYASSLDAKTPFAGFYVLAAPFRSAQLPPLARSKGRRYFIQHSPDDRIAPFWMAQAAQKLLGKQGAVVKLAPYKGAHGYNFEEDIWKEMGAALAWLEGK